MRSFTFIVAAILISGIWACKPTSSVTVRELSKDTTRALAVSGTYIGMIPCADCAQISYRLILGKDFSYAETMHYMGKSDSAFEKKGTYAFNTGGDVVLDKSTPGMHLFRQNKDGLLMLDQEGNEIKGELAGQYQLQLVKSRNAAEVQQTDLNRKKWNEGIDFYASGNEPDWSLDMDLEKGFTFRLQDGTVVTTPPVESVRVKDTNATRYQVVTDSHQLIIRIYDEKCTDSMSGEKFPNAVRVLWLQGTEKDFRTFNGCGKYILNPSLKGKWRLVSINSSPPDTAGLPKGTPVVEFDPAKGRISGHGGCNVISGTFDMTGPGILTTAPLASTKMACKGLNTETGFIKLLSDQTLNFSISEKSLTLTLKDGSVLLFNKID